jgi:hypothetical protein
LAYFLNDEITCFQLNPDSALEKKH